MLYNQPLALRFGTEIIRHLDDKRWKNFDVAVAWVRASALDHLKEPLSRFLARGGNISITVGLDLQNTTHDGLASLLSLAEHGRIETFVYHNESSGVFHPKLYLLRSDRDARLIVGSNNLTESGLFVNVEAGLQVDARVTDDVIIQTLDALSSWKDTSTGLAKRLDAALLDQLVQQDYVRDEAAAVAAMRRERKVAAGKTRIALFASKRIAAPAVQRSPRSAQGAAPQASTSSGTATTATTARRPTPSAAANNPGTVLLMRVRKSRGTQIQIPIKLVNTAFFRGITQVTSTHTGESRGINEAHARGSVNTIKLEMPETRNSQDPVARFERNAQGVTYETYDAGSPQGKQIMSALRAGQKNGSTHLTTRDRSRATWWRFI